MALVFISYRRSDCPGHAGRLYDRIVDRMGEPEVFIDIDAIPPGKDFTEYIEREIGSCAVLLALIGDDWLDSRDRDGRRLDDPDDLVRFEIAAALRRPGVRVIPVLVEGAAMPAAGTLPADLQALARRNAFELRDAHWRQDVDRLLREVVLACDPPQQSDAVSDEPPRRARTIAVVAAAVAALIVVTALIVTNLPVGSPAPTGRHACSDHQDNDHDGKTDFPSDLGCATAIDPNERGACQDGRDNDGDGKIDYGSDHGCTSRDDPAEKISACADGKDNDEDGKTDFPSDPDCSSKADIAEKT